MNHVGKWMAIVLLLGNSTFAADLTTPAYIARDTPLRERPLGDAPVVRQLPAKTPVLIVARTGAWAHITTPTGTAGYVRMLSLRTASAQQGDAGVRALAGIFKTGSSGNTVSTGVKGLSGEMLGSAVANPDEAKKLAGYAATSAQARSAAKTVGLKARKLDYLPDNSATARETE